METIVRAALGSTSSLGDMYDARTDEFIGVSALRSSIPPTARTVVDSPFSNIELVFRDNISDKFATLNVTGELQVSVLFGNLSLKGSGSYLTDQKKSARSVRSSLIYNLKTKDERLNIYHDSMRKVFSAEALQGNSGATHIVVEVNWGTNTLLTLEHDNADNLDTKEISGSLAVHMEKFKSLVSGDAKLNMTVEEKDKMSNFKFRLFGDFIPKGELPTSLDSALALMQQVPNLLLSPNAGFGKPLSYKLIPISLLKDLLCVRMVSSILLKSIDQSTVTRVIHFFEDLQNCQLEVNDFYSDADKFQYCLSPEHLESTKDLRNRVEVHAADTRNSLGNLVRKVSAG